MNAIFQRVHQLDTLAFIWVHVTKKCPYLKSVRYLSHTGDGHLYVVAGLLLWLFTEPGGVFLVTGILAYTLEVSLYLVLKNSIKRDRPAIHIKSYQPWITPSDQFSFPSGHTAAAFLFSCLVAIYFPLFAVPCYLWACMIGASRVLLGVHYPSDIAAGAALGTSCALIGVGVVSWTGTV